MDLTTALTGLLPAALIVAAIFTAAASALLLRLYRRATLRAMARSAGGNPPDPRGRGLSRPVTPSLSLIRVADDEPGDIFNRSGRALRRTENVQIAAAVVYALIMSLPWLIEAGFNAGRVLILVACILWPIVPTLLLTVAIDRRQRVMIVAIYFGLFVLAALFGIAVSTEVDLGDSLFLWIYLNAPATLLLSAFLYRQVRAVGPIVLAFMVAGVLGALLLTTAVGTNDALLHAIVRAGNTVGLGAVALYLLLNVIGFAILAAIGWSLLRWLGRRYRDKKLSDQSLTIDAIWLLFSVVQAILLVFSHPLWILTGPVAFIAHHAITRWGAHWAEGRFIAEQSTTSLLVLRVFALGRRSERLFDTLSKLWRRAGPISLISGPDLVTAVVEPHEFLDFVGGRLSRQFVQGEQDLTRRVAALDREPDPDGRYRINEFFCHADTWQMTMRRLAASSDATVMDLRSFSPTNQGCQYEIEQLLNLVELERVLFVVDETTDHSFFEATVQDLWRYVAPESPNFSAATPFVRVLDLKQSSGDAVARELSSMLGAGK